MSTPIDLLPLTVIRTSEEVYEAELHRALVLHGFTNDPAEYCRTNIVKWTATMRNGVALSIVILSTTPVPPEKKPS